MNLDPNFDVLASTNLIIGTDVYPYVLNERQVHRPNGMPSAFSYIFKWIVIGAVKQHDQTTSFHSLLMFTGPILKELIQRFWILDELE